MVGRVQLDRLDNPVSRRNRAHQQIVTRDSDGLMVAGVDLRFNLIVRLILTRQKRCQPRPQRNLDWMSLDDLPAWTVIDGCLQILNQRTVAPDIYGLGAGTDAEDRLVEVKSILQEELIHSCAAWVFLTAFGNWIFAISLWVYIKAAAGQKNPLHAS